MKNDLGEKRKKNPMNIKIPIPVVIFFAVFIAIIAYQIGKSGKETELDIYRTQIEEFQQEVDDVMEFSDSLESENRRLLRSLNDIQDEAEDLQEENRELGLTNDDLQKTADSLKLVVNREITEPIPTEVVQYITVLETQVDSLQSQVGVLEELVIITQNEVALFSRLYRQENQRADSLRVVLQNFPSDVPDNENLFGIIPLPSRTSSFAVGAVVGSLFILGAYQLGG